jgi:site-specific recombinase XerD
LTFEEIDAPLLAGFLNDLEKTRGITPRSRNLRLTAIRSFFHYAAYETPAHSAQIQRVLAIPGKTA